MEIKTPKYKIGDVVLVQSKKDSELILQGVIKSAQYSGDWFYEIFAHNPTNYSDGDELIYSYETNYGDAKTSIIDKL